MCCFCLPALVLHARARLDAARLADRSVPASGGAVEAEEPRTPPGGAGGEVRGPACQARRGAPRLRASTVARPGDGASPEPDQSGGVARSEEQTSEIQSLLHITYDVSRLKKKKKKK